MTSKQVKIPIHRYGPSVHYGYGLMISNQDELLEYSHTGYVWGYTASNLYYPTEDISVIVLENVSRGLLGMARDQKEAGFWSHDQIRKYIRSRILREVADN